MENETLKAQSEYIRQLMDANNKLKHQNAEMQADITFLKRVVYALMERTNASLILDEHFYNIDNPAFKYDENIGGTPILRIVRK